LAGVPQALAAKDYHWNQLFTSIVEETRGGVTKTLPRKDLANHHLPLYRACGDARANRR
jgi:hypothetical protein